MQERMVTIVNRLGLHARAAAKLVNLAKTFHCSISASTNGEVVDVKSIMSVMLLAASQGTCITLQADGEDEEQALDELCELIADRFGEGE